MATPIISHRQSPIGGFPPAPTPTLPLATVRSWTHTNNEFQTANQSRIDGLMQQLFSETIVQQLSSHTPGDFNFSLFVKQDESATMTVSDNNGTFDLLTVNNSKDENTQRVMTLIHHIIGAQEDQISPSEGGLRASQEYRSSTQSSSNPQTTSMAELQAKLAESEEKNQSLQAQLTSHQTLMQSSTAELKHFRTVADSRIAELEGELEKANKKLTARHQDTSSPHTQALEKLRTSLEQAQKEKAALEEILGALNNQGFVANNGEKDPPPAFDEKDNDWPDDLSIGSFDDRDKRSADLEHRINEFKTQVLHYESSEMIQNAKMRELEEQLRANKGEIIHLKASRADLLEQIELNKGKTEEAKVDLDAIDETIQEKLVRINALEEALAGHIKVAEEEKAAHTRTILGLQQEIVDIESYINTANGERQQAKNELEYLKLKLAGSKEALRLREELHDLREEKNKEALAEIQAASIVKVEELNKAVSERSTRIADLEARINAVNEEKQQAESHLVLVKAAYIKRIEELEDEVKNIEKFIEGANKERQDANNKLEIAEAKIAKLKESDDLLAKEIDWNENKIEELSQEIETGKAKNEKLWILAKKHMKKHADMKKDYKQLLKTNKNLAVNAVRATEEKNEALLQLQTANRALGETKQALDQERENKSIGFEVTLEQAKAARSKAEAELTEAQKQFVERNSAQLQIIDELKEQLASQIAANNTQAPSIIRLEKEIKSLNKRNKNLIEGIKKLEAYRKALLNKGSVHL